MSVMYTSASQSFGKMLIAAFTPKFIDDDSIFRRKADRDGIYLPMRFGDVIIEADVTDIMTEAQTGRISQTTVNAVRDNVFRQLGKAVIEGCPCGFCGRHVEPGKSCDGCGALGS